MRRKQFLASSKEPCGVLRSIFVLRARRSVGRALTKDIYQAAARLVALFALCRDYPFDKIVTIALNRGGAWTGIGKSLGSQAAG